MKLKGEALFFILIVAVVLAGLVGLFALTNKPQQVTNTTNLVRDTNYFTGPKNAKVTLVEFGDFQCPACKAVEGVVEQIRVQYKDSVKVVFKNFPITSHANAVPASEAAEAAGAQGKYWEFHDKLYQTQEEWTPSNDPVKLFLQYAKDLNLDTDKMKSDIDSKKYADKINTDQSDGLDVGVSATPTFFLNGEKIVGGLTFDEFKQKIDAKLAGK